MAGKKELSDKHIRDLFITGKIDQIKLKDIVNDRYKKEDADILFLSLLEDKQRVDRTHRTVKFLETGGSICESVIFKEAPTFLTYSPKDEKWQSNPIITNDTVAYHPVDQTPYTPYKFTHEEFERLAEGYTPPPLTALFDEVYKELNTFVKAPPEIISLLTAFVLETYQQNKIFSLSYVFTMGLTESGKTRIAELLTFLCYRTLFASDLNAANVYDFIGEEGEGSCTIVDDEAQDFADDKDKLKLYRQGYKKGAKVRRILDAGSAKRTPRYMDVFCSKFFAGYYMPYDRAFRERCIPFTQIEGSPIKDEFSPDDIKRFAVIKKRLLLSRMAHYYEPLPEVELPYRGRMKELWKSKIQVVAGLPAEQTMRDLAEQYKKDTEDEKKISLESFLTRSLLALREIQRGPQTFSSIWSALCWALGETENVNRTKFYSETLNREVSKTVVGLMLKSAFGGRPSVTATRQYLFNNDMLEALKQKFKVHDDDVKVLQLLIESDSDKEFF